MQHRHRDRLPRHRGARPGLAVTPFFGDVIGLVPGEPAATAPLTWRNDDAVQRLDRARPAPPTTPSTSASRPPTRRPSTPRSPRLAAAGFELHDGTDDGARRPRRVADLAHTTAPWGVRVELVHGLDREPGGFSSPLVPGGFLTDGVGFGHVVFATLAFDESHRFLTEGLGIEQSDWLEMEIAEGIELEVRFYHCNERHHTVALAEAPFEMPQTLHHVMFEVEPTATTSVRAFDRAWGDRARHRQRAGPPRQRRHVQLLRGSARPASRSRSATAPGSSPTTGTTTAATTASAPGVTSRCTPP